MSEQRAPYSTLHDQRRPALEEPRQSATHKGGVTTVPQGRPVPIDEDYAVEAACDCGNPNCQPYVRVTSRQKGGK